MEALRKEVIKQASSSCHSQAHRIIKSKKKINKLIKIMPAQGAVIFFQAQGTAIFMPAQKVGAQFPELAC